MGSFLLLLSPEPAACIGLFRIGRINLYLIVPVPLYSAIHREVNQGHEPIGLSVENDLRDIRFILES